MKVKELLNNGIKKLEINNVEDSALQAKVLLSYILKIDKSKIIINSDKIVDNQLENLYLELIEKLVQGKPIQYITNKQEFMKLNFYVDENVLIPQPDTEILVEQVLQIAKKMTNTQIRILDLCSGSGAIGISLAKYIENCEVWAVDISNKALQISKLNAEKNLVHRKMKFIESNMFEQIANEKFDIIVSNPPYIKTEVIKKLSKQVKQEPHIALDGGTDGLEFYRIIANNAYMHLNSLGILCLEIGFDQKDDVKQLLEDVYKYGEIECIQDLNKNDRVIICRKN